VDAPDGPCTRRSTRSGTQRALAGAAIPDSACTGSNFIAQRCSKYSPLISATAKLSREGIALTSRLLAVWSSNMRCSTCRAPRDVEPTRLPIAARVIAMTVMTTSCSTSVNPASRRDVRHRKVRDKCDLRKASCRRLRADPGCPRRSVRSVCRDRGKFMQFVIGYERDICAKHEVASYRRTVGSRAQTRRKPGTTIASSPSPAHDRLQKAPASVSLTANGSAGWTTASITPF